MPSKFKKYVSPESRARKNRLVRMGRRGVYRAVPKWAAKGSIVGPRDRIATQGIVQRDTRQPYIDRGPVAPELFTKLRYCERILVNSAPVTGLGGPEVVFRLGSLFDPNATGVGHQPYLYDQISPLYWKYIVYGATVQIDYTSTPDANLVVMYMVANSAATTDLLNIQSFDANERPGCGTIRTTAFFPAATCRLDYLSLPQIEGKSYQQYMSEDANYAAFTNQNPTFSPLLRVNAASDSLTADQTAVVTVTIVYHVKFFQRRLHGQS